MELLPTLITLIVATIELVVCAACAVLLWNRRRGMPDLSRLMLALGAAHCVVTSLGKYFSILMRPTDNLYYEVLSMELTRWGMLSVLLMLAYPVSIARPEWFRSWRSTLLYLSPGLLLFFAPAAFPEVHHLYSFDELRSNLGEPDVIFRLLMLPFILLYCAFMMGRLVSLGETGTNSLWLRRYIALVMGLLLLVSAYSHTHVICLHYVHQLCVAAFYGYWTYYELVERVYTAPAEMPACDMAAGRPVADERQRFLRFDEQVDRRQLYAQPGISRDDLCRVMGTDRTTFSRIITEQSGCTNLSAYLNQKRIRHADMLMREQPHYSIEAIMADCGYKSKATFNRVFKDFYGTTPSEYRKTLPPVPELPN